MRMVQSWINFPELGMERVPCDVHIGILLDFFNLSFLIKIQKYLKYNDKK
jgi:hypothetical protein